MRGTEAQKPFDPVASRRALVTGATGVVGPVLVNHLVRVGYLVRALDRLDPEPGTFPPGVECLRGDICDPELIGHAVEGVDAVFHLAARLHIPNPPPELRPEYWRVNVEGTRVVAEACSAAGVRRLVFFSTINVYGAIDGKEADEDTPPCPKDLYSETKFAAEKLALSAKNRSTGRPLGAVLRMAAIYGPRMKGRYPDLVNALARGWFLPVGDGTNRRTLIFIEDVARAALVAAEHPQAAGRVFNVTDGEVHSLREILATMCAALGRRPPRFYLPLGPVCLAARLVDSFAGVAGRSFDLSGKIKKFTEDVAVSGERIRQELGFQPLYGLEEGWRRTLAGRKAGRS